jgi:hypothetical protein
MSESERRHFKRASIRWGTPKQAGKEQLNYTRIFDLVVKSISTKHPDQTLQGLLLKEFGAQLDNYRIAKQAGYLYDKILADLIQIPDQNSAFFELNESMQKIQWLVHRKLYDQAQQILKSALSLATSLCLPGYIYQLRVIEQSILTRVSNLTPLANAEILSSSIIEVRQELDLTREIEEVHSHILNTILSNTPLPQHLVERVENWYKTYHLENQRHLLSDRLSMRMYLVFSEFGATADRFDVKTVHKYALVDLLETYMSIVDANPYLKEENIEFYFKSACRHLFWLLLNDEVDKFNESLTLLRKNNAAKMVKSLYFSEVAFIIIQHYNKIDDFKNAKAFIEQEKVLSNLLELNLQITPNRLLAIYYTGIQVYFRLEEYQQVDAWAKRVIQMNIKAVHPYVTDVAYIAQIIAGYQLKKDWVTDRIAGAKNYFKRKYKLRGSKELVYLTMYATLLEKSINATNTTQRKALIMDLDKLYQYYLKHIKDLVFYEFVLAWLGVHIRGPLKTTMEAEIEHYLTPGNESN